MIVGCRLGGLVALVTATGLLLGACGGGGQASSSSMAAATPSAPARSTEGHESATPYTPRSREEKRAYRTATGLYRALAVARSGGANAAQGAGAACKLMSAGARERMVSGAEAASSPGTELDCEHAFRFLLKRSGQGGTLTTVKRERVIGVHIVGETAMATVEAISGKTSRLQLVKEGGRWKVVAASG
jgi:hypothetical protein